GLLRVVLIHQRPRILDAMAVEIADRHDARGVVLPETGQVVAAGDPPVADRADVDAVRGRGGAEDRRWHDRRESGNHGCGDDTLSGGRQKVPPRCRARSFASHESILFLSRIPPYVKFTRCACFCALSISSVARKQCSCGIAVSVRFNTSDTSAGPYGSAT